MELTIRHFIPGRVRLHVPSLGRRPSLAKASLKWLRARDGIRSARINYECACLIVEYDVAYEALLRAVIGRLRLMSIAELRSLVIATDVGDDTPTECATGRLDDSQSLLRRVPLALPTLSVALAFSANPIVRAINLPLMLWNAYPIALRAWRVWQRERRLNVDFLDTLAVAASLAQGNPMAGAIVTWLIKLGDWIRDLTAAGSRRAIRELLEFQVKTAWVIRDGALVSIPSSELAIGDEVVVHHGGVIPIDGEIIAGQALIDQKTITGEGLPVTRGKGDAAFAATVVSDGHLTIRATRGRRRHYRRTDRAARRIRADRRHPHAEPRRAAGRPAGRAGAGAGNGGGGGVRGFRPVPLAGDRRLRHRHPRGGADRRAGIDDARGAHGHHHQERPAPGAPRRGRHRRLRQDRHLDPRRARRSRRAHLSGPHHARSSARAGGGGGNEAATSRGGGIADQGPGVRRQHPTLRGSAVSGRARSGRPSQRLLLARRQRAFHAAKRHLRAQDRQRSFRPR